MSKKVKRNGSILCSSASVLGLWEGGTPIWLRSGDFFITKIEALRASRYSA